MLLCARSPEHLGPICQIRGQKVDSHLRKIGMLRARAWVPSERVSHCMPMHPLLPNRAGREREEKVKKIDPLRTKSATGNNHFIITISRGEGIKMKYDDA